MGPELDRPSMCVGERRYRKSARILGGVPGAGLEARCVGRSVEVGCDDDGADDSDGIG